MYLYLSQIQVDSLCKKATTTVEFQELKAENGPIYKRVAVSEQLLDCDVITFEEVSETLPTVNVKTCADAAGSHG